MKTFYTILILTSCFFCIIQIMSFKSTSNIESYKYEVLKKINNFEIRQYQEALFIKTELEFNNYETISSDGFRILAGYIFGKNDRNQKISMTSPVTMDVGTNRSMYFMLPSEYKFSDLPTPNSDQINIISKNKQKVAAISFSGWANEQEIQKYISILKESLKAHNIAHTNNFQFLGYNPPYEIINRRNEVIVEIL